MGLIKRPGSDYWYIEFIHNGRRFKASSGTTKKAVARAIEATMRADLVAGSDLASLPKATLGEAISRYIDAIIKPKNNAKVLSADGYLLEAVGPITVVSRQGPGSWGHALAHLAPTFSPASGIHDGSQGVVGHDVGRHCTA